jgi:hypothetical protein
MIEDAERPEMLRVRQGERERETVREREWQIE